MSFPKQAWIITTIALGAYFMLRSLPDTQCAFLHADHQPVVVDGLEFCGVNEEANFYSPKELRFPVTLKIKRIGEGSAAELLLIKEEGLPFYGHEVGVSHTKQVHLHLLQAGGERRYAHLHPMPSEDGTWHFDFPAQLYGDTPVRAYVDFADARTGRVMLAETIVENVPPIRHPQSPTSPRNQIVSTIASSTRAGTSAQLRLLLAGPGGAALKLKPVMGSLGHAVIFSTEAGRTGYAHMHPTLEGGEYAETPTLTFRLRLPPAGQYDLWLHINDGQEELLRTTLVVTP